MHACVYHGDRPDLVPDADVLRCRRSGWTGVWSMGHWRLFWSYTLERQLSIEEAREIFSKVNGLGPVQFEHSYASILRENTLCFWRSQI